MIYENLRLAAGTSFPATSQNLKTCASTKKKFALVAQNDLNVRLAQLENASARELH
jgi:hypothetical protein